jgi:hypothetical protein
MNPELVYCRTAEGERLARVPRQIASYAQRATLLLLDGQISVGELVRRFGETLPIEEALEQLERNGLAHLRETPGNAVESPEFGDSADVPVFGPDPLFDPAVDEISEERLVREAPPEPTLEDRQEVRRMQPGELRLEPTEVLSGAALTEMESPPAKGGGGASPALSMTPAAQFHRVPAAAEAPVGQASAPTPVSPANRRRFKSFGLVVLLVALVGGLALMLSGLRPEVEARARAALGVPVSVGSVGFSVRHGPALALGRVTIGGPVPFVLEQVEAKPGPRQGSVWSAHRLRVVDASLTPSELSTLASLVGSSETVVEFAFSGLTLRLGELAVGGLAGSLERADGRVTLRLADPAGGLTLLAQPREAGLALQLTASPGVLPVLGRPKIGTVELRGLLKDGGLENGELGMTGYGGKFEGSLVAAWGGSISLEATLRMAAVSMAQVSQGLFERGGFADGQASGTVFLRARSARWDELNRIDDLEASFVVERGALKGFDLGAALRERWPRPISGGETRFESLRGRLEAGPQEIRLRIERLDSGALSASGQLKVSGFESLHGNLSASVQIPGRGPLTYPAVLAGTVALPTIQLRLPAAEMSTPIPGGAER